MALCSDSEIKSCEKCSSNPAFYRTMVFSRVGICFDCYFAFFEKAPRIEEKK